MSIEISKAGKVTRNGKPVESDEAAAVLAAHERTSKRLAARNKIIKPAPVVARSPKGEGSS